MTVRPGFCGEAQTQAWRLALRLKTCGYGNEPAALPPIVSRVVSDYSTRRLMAAYYKNLKEGEGRGASLRRVQLELLNSRRHSFFWANFIQVGEWDDLNGER